ncbi:MAG: VCBS repeat-containing protein, partial [Thermoanaerobaculia bacterium]|nr:VCBS repeat-containing protein [Thermoanaerobaculia bacterium]
MRRSRRRPLGCVALLVLFAAGCGERRSVEEPPPGPPREPFTDATGGSGIAFVHANGATVDRRLPETMGSGVALLDFDGDGLEDLFFVDGSPQGASALYRYLGGWRFEEVSERAGARIRAVGMGAAVGDVEGDGDADLFVSAVGEDFLLRNRGDGGFEDASEALAELAPGFGSGAAFVDVDRDGRHDLYVGRYVTWSPETDVACVPDGVHRTYCTPEVYPGASNRLLLNRGDGRFRDATAEAGLELSEGKTLGVVPLDANDDGWPDLAVANDTTRNFLFVNRGDGSFEERGVEAGIAFGASGAPRGGMGIDAGDLSGAGPADIVVGNFAQEMSAVFRSRPGGLYSDDAAPLGLGLPTLMTLAFGTLVADLDLDGWSDVALANGHIEPEIQALRPGQTYAQPVQLFRRVPGEERFEPVVAAALAEPRVGRGLAAGDLDADGDVDLVLTQNGGPPVLLRNEAVPAGWLGLRAFPGPAGLDTRATLVAGGRER